MSWLYKMGNICPVIATRGSDKMNRPRNLEELLGEFRCVDPDTLEEAISGYFWAQRFLEYLKGRGLTEQENNLRFLVMTQQIINIDNQIKKGKLDPRKQAQLKSEQAKIFKKTIVRFFNEESEELLSLTNQMLFDALCSVKDEPNDSDMDHLRQAREDDTVWSEGLDPEYSRFIGRASPLACLLSIL